MQKRQAENMISTTVKRFKPAEKGNNVMIPVPDVDRGRAEFRNVKGVILDAETDGTNTIGTNHGTLKQKYVRSQFIPTSGNFF